MYLFENSGLEKSWLTYRTKRKIRYLSIRLQESDLLPGWLRKRIVNRVCDTFFSGREIARGLLSRLIRELIRRLDSFSPGMRRSIQSLIDKLPLKRSTEDSTARYYLKNSLSKEEFFRALNEKACYVVLRWNRNVYENWTADNDLDVLVLSEDLDRILELCTKERIGSGLKIDIYTSTHIAGFLYRGCSYFSGSIAQEILSARRLSTESIYVPSENHQTLSFLYHLLFHKSDIVFTSKSCSHTMTAQASRYLLEAIYLSNQTIQLFEVNEGVLDLSTKGISKVLTKGGWFPSVSNVRFLSLENSALRELLLSELSHKQDSASGDLVTLVIREKAIDLGFIPLIIKYIRENGYCILHHAKIDDKRRLLSEREIRNGNWGGSSYIRGIGGGPPAYIISYIDFDPVFKGYNHNEEFPFVNNTNVRKKQELRQLLSDELYYWDQCHIVHSSDDQCEALEYLAICLEKSLYNDVYTCFRAHLDAFKRPSCSIRELSTSRARSRVDLMANHKALFVRKTYRLDKLDYMHRELSVYTLANNPSFAPRLLSAARNSFDLEYIDAEPAKNYLISSSRRQLLKSLILDIYHESYSLGFALIDLNMTNLLIDAHGRPWVIDYEYCHHYKRHKPGESFVSGYDLVGVPPDSNIEVPGKSLGEGRTYNNTWLKFLGPITQKEIDLCISRNNDKIA